MADATKILLIVVLVPPILIAVIAGGYVWMNRHRDRKARKRRQDKIKLL